MTSRMPRRGISVLEIVVGVALISGALIAIITAFTFTVKIGFGHIERVKAAFLLEEGLEGMRSIRDTGWTANFSPLTVGTTYYLTFGTSSWQATTAPQIIDNEFTRTIVLSSVYRRTSDSDIVPATSTQTKTLDPDIRKVTVTVSWNGGSGTRSGTTTGVTYFTNLFDN